MRCQVGWRYFLPTSKPNTYVYAQELQLQERMLEDLDEKTDKTQEKMDKTNDRLKDAMAKVNDKGTNICLYG